MSSSNLNSCAQVQLPFQQLMSTQLIKHRTVLTPQLDAMISTPQATIQTFSSFQKNVPAASILLYRNQLVRSLIIAFRKKSWSEQESQQAVPILQWLLKIKKSGRDGAYRLLCYELLEQTQKRLILSDEQKKGLKQILTARPPHIPQGLGRQSENAVATPANLYVAFDNER